MPSARRRRFNVQNELATPQKPKRQNETQISHLDPALEIEYFQNVLGEKNIKSKNKIHPNTSKRASMHKIISGCTSNTSTETVLEFNIKKSHKEVTASSSNIDLCSMLSPNNLSNVSYSKENTNNIIGDDTVKQKKSIENKNIGSINKTERISRRDKHSHRIKVRSPKRKAPAVIEKNISKTKSIAIDAVEWEDDLIEKDEVECEIVKQITEIIENVEEEEERVSSHSVEDMCRICHSGEATSVELGHLISTCACRGTVGRVHVKCLERWLTESGKSRCELCGTKYVTKRVHKFGVLKSLAIWILSNHSKHMIVDFFGIMIMTPIAVVAAGLTGRTFAGLMAQDQMTAWPLASTFVLACMTLVCYYCWIVSALTRHALGWWIWYRSHYEVRLQLNDYENSQLSIDNNILY